MIDRQPHRPGDCRRTPPTWRRGACACSRRRPARRAPNISTSMPRGPPATAGCRRRRRSCFVSTSRCPIRSRGSPSMGVDIAQVLHGGERFRYFAPVYAGDRLTFSSRIADILQKKSSEKAFVVKETDVTNQHGVKVAEMRATIVVREIADRAADAAAPSTRSTSAMSLPPLSLPPVTRDDARALRRRVGRSQSDPHRHRFRPRGRDARRVRARHAVDGLARAPADRTGRRSSDLREFGVRFSAMTLVGERITCTGRVVDKQERDGERLAKVEVTAVNDAGELKVAGDAWIALPLTDRCAYRSPWLDDELESFRGTVRRFVGDVLAPREPAWQAAHRVDAASWREMGAMGLLLCAVPEEYGGSGGTFAHDCIVFEELAYAGVASFGKIGPQHLRPLRRDLRHRRAEAALAAAARERRARRGDRDVRACGRLRSAGHPHACASAMATATSSTARRRSSPTARSRTC